MELIAYPYSSHAKHAQKTTVVSEECFFNLIVSLALNWTSCVNVHGVLSVVIKIELCFQGWLTSSSSVFLKLHALM